MEVEYRLFWDDIAAFHRQHSGKKRGGAPAWIGWAFVAVLFVGFCLKRNEFPWWAVWTVTAFVALYFGLSLVVWIMWRNYRRNVSRDLEHRFAKGNAKVSLAADGIYHSDAHSQAFTSWPGILRIVDTPTHAFFYVQREQAIIVPARAFESEVAFGTFVGLARDYKEGLAAVPEPAPPPAAPGAITRTTDFTS